MIRPRLVAPQTVVAEEQDEFKPVTIAVVLNPNYPSVSIRGHDGEAFEANSVVMAFKPDEAELRRLNAGEPVYLSLLTFMRPQQGVILSVGTPETAAMYGVEVEP